MCSEYYEVKRSAYGVVCITPDFHGSVTVWETLEEAESDAKERVDEYLFLPSESLRFEAIKVDDGYEIRRKDDSTIVRCYKIFEVQELE